VAPELLIKAILIEQDPTFWQNPGYMPQQAYASMLANLFGNTWDGSQTLTQQLVGTTLLPLEQYPAGSLRKNFRTTLLAERLNNRFEKTTILEWYLNSAYFGPYLFGVDSASLAYFGKHADGLTLGEMALLAAIPGRGEEALASPTLRRQAQREVLEELVEAGEISLRQAGLARAQPLIISSLETTTEFPQNAAARLAIHQAAQSYGTDIFRRVGLTYVATLDRDLQEQAECLLATQLERLSDPSAAGSGPVEQASPCLAAGLLPPVRPNELGADYQAQAGALVLIEAESGQLRAYAGQAGKESAASPLGAHQAGEAIHPFIYLTAFSRGFSPGSMVLDLPADSDASSVTVADGSLTDFNGPVRMRQALTQGLKGAAANTIELAGPESVARTLQEFGLMPSQQEFNEDEIVLGQLQVSPTALAFAYSALANEGIMTGHGNGMMTPTALDRIEDRFGRSHDVGGRQRRVILSQGLAYLINDALRLVRGADQRPELPIINRPAAAISAEAPNGGGSWTVAYTPQSAVVSWFGSMSKEGAADLTAARSSAPAASALLRYATRDEPAQDWAQPIEVNQIEVCDPSGLLPTSYCPNVVPELFLQGTEPTAFDNLYRPFRLNGETGNLATLATPLELIEEEIYLIPPPEAAEWARAVGLPQPPSQYDPLPAIEQGDDMVNIESPAAFEVIRGVIEVEGDAHPSDFDFYRLQVGVGLNPTRWIQIGEDEDRRVWGGSLAKWDTEALSGLYTLQLVVVLDNGQIRTASVPVTIDNVAPTVSLLQPEQDEELYADEFIQVEIAVGEMLGVEQVEVGLDGRIVSRLTEPPYLVRLDPMDVGRHELTVQAIDLAGNQSEVVVANLIVLP
jgi:membrane peptidoglycan carboxypeptidase